MLQDVRIDTAEIDDAAAIAVLHHLAHTVSFQSFAEPEWIQARILDDYLDFWGRYLREQEEGEQTWVARHNGTIIATVTIMKVSNSSEHFMPSQRSVSVDEVACLRLMYVHPDHQRAGIGKQLMSHAVEFMQRQGYRLATLITHASNDVARSFYEQRGWQLDLIFDQQVEEFFEDPASMRGRARYMLELV